MNEELVPGRIDGGDTTMVHVEVQPVWRDSVEQLMRCARVRNLRSGYRSLQRRLRFVEPRFQRSPRKPAGRQTVRMRTNHPRGQRAGRARPPGLLPGARLAAVLTPETP
jgi:hypothetical protein